ncbi:MAG: RHS repeat-associated core domain-containing protein, partial [Armatimonadota bacterium]
SAWGSRNAPGFTTSVGFTGHRAEDVLGLTYAQQRWYDSTTGRFLSRDSVGAGSYLATPNGLGVWGYANGNPTRYADAHGRDPAEISAREY